MTVVELGLQSIIERWSNVGPYLYRTTVNIQKMAFFWLSIFRCRDERISDKDYILAVIANALDRFGMVNDEEEVRNTFETWYFDFDSQVLLFNCGPNYNPLYDSIEYQRAIGYCDTRVVSVGGKQMLPVLTEAPTVTADQDMINYDQLAFGDGNVQAMNYNGLLDNITNMKLFSNDLRVYYLADEPGRDEYDRDELVPISGMLVDDIKNSMQRTTFTLKDAREAMNVKVPTHLFSKTDYPDMSDDQAGKPIPLMYGQCAVVPGICVNQETTSGPATYRFCELLTVLGDVQVEDDGAWVSVTPVSVDLANGSVTLAEADARNIPESGIVDGPPRNCRMVNGTGIANSNPGDVIIDLDYRANGITFTDSFYVVEELTAELGGLLPVGILIDEATELNEIIRMLQEGSSNRFRYEYNAQLLRTARLDNPERASRYYVTKEEILENDRIELYTDRKVVAAYVVVEYGKDYEANKVKQVTDTSSVSSVARSIREKPTITFETFLQTIEAAQARAALEAARLGRIRWFTKLTLRGERYLTLRVYDMLTVELMSDKREWAGVWKCEVIGTDPDTKGKTNKVRLVLEEKVARPDDDKILRVVDNGDIRIAVVGTTEYIREVR